MKNIKNFTEFISENDKYRSNIPNDEKLWNKAIRLSKGTKHGGSSYVTYNGERYDAPNDGKGFDVYPSAYANAFASKMYKKWGGTWKKNPKVNEDLRNWFKEKWVRIDTQGNIAGDCGTMPDDTTMQRCLPEKKAKSLSKSERKATVDKKIEGSKKGKQFVKNTKKGKVTKKYRKD